MTLIEVCLGSVGALLERGSRDVNYFIYLTQARIELIPDIGENSSTYGRIYYKKKVDDACFNVLSVHGMY